MSKFLDQTLFRNVSDLERQRSRELRKAEYYEVGLPVAFFLEGEGSLTELDCIVSKHTCLILIDL